MTHEMTTEGQVIDILRRAQACDLEEIIRQCPNLTWNQVFLAVDRLSRRGEIRLMLIDRGIYTLTFPTGRKVGPVDAHSHRNHKEVVICLH